MIVGIGAFVRVTEADSVSCDAVSELPHPTCCMGSFPEERRDTNPARAP
jgi:hypothetical protein